MKTRIPIGELRPGMHLVGLDIPWELSPFLRHEMTIDNEHQIDKLRECGVRYVEIQTDDGGRREPDDGPDLPPEAPVSVPEAPDPVPYEVELIRAKAVYVKAKAILKDSMEEVRMGRTINTGAVTEVANEMVESLFRNRDALAGLSRLKSFDEYTFFHSVNVGILATALGLQQGFPKDELICLGAGALLHDIGKVTIPLSILNKPGRFTQNEYEIMKRHPEAGAEILRKTPGISEESILPALEHQERGDGTGYPYKKKLPEMSRYGLITQIADVYDAMTTDRVYHKAKTPYDILRYLYQLGESGQLDHITVQHFIQCTSIYPIGSLVELDSGERGLILSVNHSKLLAPRVMIVMNKQRARISPPCPVMDLSDPSVDPPRSIRSVLDPSAFGINPAAYLEGLV